VVSVITVEKQDCTERHTSEKSETTESGRLGGMVVVRTRIVGGGGYAARSWQQSVQGLSKEWRAGLRA
jgi:hypothetical protein